MRDAPPHSPPHSPPHFPAPVTRRDALQRLALTALAAPAILRRRYRLAPGLPEEYSARAIRLVQESVVVDLLNQFRFADFAESPPKSTLWLTKARSMTAADFETYRTSGHLIMPD